MKRITTTLIALLVGYSVFAQEGFKLGLNAGLPIGKDADPYTIHLQGNLDYLFHVTKDIHVGITTAYSRYLGEKTDNADVEDLVYVPLGGSAQFNVTDKLKFGGDLGYALILQPDASDGGIFYVPKVQYMLSPNSEIVLAYRGLTIDRASISSITIGIEFGFFEE